MRQYTIKQCFRYWFAHWCAYQMTAINLGVWRPKFLIHDMAKPFMAIFMPLDKVHSIHTKYSKHHLQRYDKKYDYVAMVIDWECSRFTKKHATLTAKEFLEKRHPELKEQIQPILSKLNLL